MGTDRNHEDKRAIEDAEADESVEGHVNFRPLDNAQPGGKQQGPPEKRRIMG